MNQEYIIYAQKIKVVGDKILSIVNSTKSIDSTRKYNLTELKDVHQSLFNAVDEYKKCKNDLLSINPPNSVKQKHILLSNALQMFIDGTELMSKSIDLNLLKFDEDLLNKGIAIQDDGVEQTVKLTSKIGDILIKG